MNKKKIKIQTTRKVEQTCPVCREKKLLTIHHILPRYIMKEIKTDEKNFFLNGKNSYWLCSKCHGKYENKANSLRKKLLKSLSYPVQSDAAVIQVKNLVKIKNLCRYMTGKFHKNNYDFSIYRAYDFVKKFYNKKYLPYDEIERLSTIKDTIANPKYISHGKFLVDNMEVKDLDMLYRENLISFLKKRNVDENNLIPKINEYYEI